ncbi:unnamed protein product [Cylindrotheca closterium]|uniref:Uncharacterized protein n=1 Tax=Cylindrotheca closterium TaxID=2856 RepID=A0AAD2CQB8_9STRA|nr:unnamed protein product [Cylindrotheca closterium]
MNRSAHQLAEFALLFLSTDPNDWDFPSSQARASALLPTTLPDNHVLCSVSSFGLEKRKHHSGTLSKESLAVDIATSFDDELQFATSDMQALGPTITRNILQSFMTLVDSRVRSTVQALYKHAQHDSSQRLMQILQTLSTMSDSIVTPTKASSRTQVVEGGICPRGGEISAPVLMETIIEVEIMGEQLSVVLEAAGTIIAMIEPFPSAKIVRAKVAFDTSSFLKTLMANARDCVKYATKRLFEVFLSPSNNIQDTQAMDSRSMLNGNKKRSRRTCKLEKKGSLPRLSPAFRTMRAREPRLQSKLQSSYLNGKSLSGVDLLKMAAECLA